MQTSASTGNNIHTAMDDRLNHDELMLENVISFKTNPDILNDIAESLVAALEDECCNESSLFEHDWQLCQRLLPETLPSPGNIHSSFLNAGYTDCMDEAIRYLVEEEDMSPDHPLVSNLKTHLEEAKHRFLSSSVCGVDNNNETRTTCTQGDISYDCYVAVNLLKSSSICNNS